MVRDMCSVCSYKTLIRNYYVHEYIYVYIVYKSKVEPSRSNRNYNGQGRYGGVMFRKLFFLSILLYFISVETRIRISRYH